MFRARRQCGFIPVLQSFGASPLELWDMKVQNGAIRRVTDEQVRALALELSGTNVSTCLVYCPRDPRASLGINMPYLVMIVKNLKRYFTFEVTILDDTGAHRRFRLSNFQKVMSIQYFTTSMPLCLNPGWNEIFFNLSEFTRKAYKTKYVETTRIQVHANCRIRVIYFCDRLYEDSEIPKNLKIFLPISSMSKKKEDAPPPKPESVPGTDLGTISQIMYEFEDEGEHYSIKGSMMTEVKEVEQASVKPIESMLGSSVMGEGGESMISDASRLKSEKEADGSVMTLAEPDEQQAGGSIAEAPAAEVSAPSPEPAAEETASVTAEEAPAEEQPATEPTEEPAASEGAAEEAG